MQMIIIITSSGWGSTRLGRSSAAYARLF